MGGGGVDGKETCREVKHTIVVMELLELSLELKVKGQSDWLA